VWSDTADLTLPLHYFAQNFVNTQAGFGIRYEIQDTWAGFETGQPNNGAPFYAWAVNQSQLNTTETFGGYVTLIPETEFRHSADSALVFSGNADGNQEIWGFIGGMPTRNQGGFLADMVVMVREMKEGPAENSLSATDSPAPHGIEYSYSYGGGYSIGGSELDTLRIDVTIDQAAAESLASGESQWIHYHQGEGYVRLARGIGIVEVRFERDDGTSLSYDYVDHRVTPQHTVTGTLVDSNGKPASGYLVHQDLIVGTFQGQSDPLPGDTTDANGSFAVDAYGPVARLYVGTDDDGDGVFSGSELKTEVFVSDTTVGDIGEVP
jgi:hypothetical protein